MKSTIIYTKTDEAPALATGSFFSIMKRFVSAADINLELWDISLAGRILATFPDYLQEDQRVCDDLGRLGQLVHEPYANIIKLPNISASIPQIKGAVKELQVLGYALPDYPDEPKDKREKEIKERYDRVKGSAVNPVLREGNSDRRAPGAVKRFAQSHPHSMGPWREDSRSHVASMDRGDFYESEQSLIMEKEQNTQIVFKTKSGEKVILKESLHLLKDEIIDGSFMSQKALRAFIVKEKEEAKRQGVLFSIHLKATMMKVSDPIIFGQALEVFFADLFKVNKDLFAQLGINANNGLGDLLNRIETLEEGDKQSILDQINKEMASGPHLAMVNSDLGITNFHVPSDIIIDASMPAAIRNSGQMWGPDGQAADTKFIIPDRSYAGIYDQTIKFCKANGAFDPRTMGSVSNVGLMAQKAEEYGSHDKTFQIPEDGQAQLIGEEGEVLLSFDVEKGDVFRMCQTKDEPVKDWVKLAISRGRATDDPVVFWLDEKRAHDRNIRQKVEGELKNYDVPDLDIHILNPEEAILFSLKRCKEGLNTISVTGNVLRDYLTDLFPILELGTSAKMLSVVPLMAGGGLYETGAGGSAPKHVQQFNQEGHLRWDSLGEFLALTVSLEALGEKENNPKALCLAKALDQGVEKLLSSGKSPSRKAGEIDNRGSQFYLALYWAEALASCGNKDLEAEFAPLAEALRAHEEIIVQEIAQSEGVPQDIGGYYMPDQDRLERAMRPSETFNKIL